MMKRFKKELSWLLVAALVVSSLALGLGQLQPKAATQATGQEITYHISMKTRAQTCEGSGTDSNYKLRLTQSGFSDWYSGVIDDTGASNDQEAGDTNNMYVTGPARPLGAVYLYQDNSNGGLWQYDWIRVHVNFGAGEVEIASIGSGEYNTTGGSINLNYNGAMATYNRTLTFDGNGGNVAGASTYTLYAIQGATLPAANFPAKDARTGYTEKTGWFAATSGGSAVTMPTTGPASTTYYAQWDANTYLLTFDPQSGSVSPTTSTVTYNGTYGGGTGGFPSASRTGYNFGGWYTSTGGGGTNIVTGTTYATAGGSTIYAKWTPKTYTLTFDPQSGSVSPGSSTVTYNGTYGGGTGGFPSASRTGYTFDGWYTSTGGGGTNIVTSTTYTTDGGSTIYAKWSPNTNTAYKVEHYQQNVAQSAYVIVSADTQNLTGTTGATVSGTAKSYTGFTYNAGASTPSGTIAADGSLVLKLNYTRNSYNLVYDANTGTGTMSNTGILYQGSGTVANNSFTAPAGKSFAGWNTAANGIGTSYSAGGTFSNMPANDVTLYAQWTANTYYLVYDANGGTGTMTNTGILYGGSGTVSSNGFTAPVGKSFANWNTAADGTGTPYNAGGSFSNMPANNVTLYAQWTFIQYTVSFNSNGGSAVIPVTQSYGTTVAVPSPPPTKTGYTFGGWYYDNNTFANAVAWPHTIAADVMFYAKWTAITYTVAYNGNTSTSGSTTSSSHTYNATNNLATNGFAKTGHTFNGWNTLADGTGTSYTSGQLAVGNLSATQGATVTLYAQWTLIQYTVSFNSNGGTAIGHVTDDYGTTVALPTPPPTKIGHTFGGWYYDNNTFANAVSWPHTITADVTFYAKWTADSYTVTFNANGGGTPSLATIQVTYGGTYGTLATIARDGHDFDGWFTATTGGIEVFAGDTVAITANQTLYAQWTTNEYTITFALAGGIGQPPPITQDYGTTVTPPADPTKTGYTFTGWYPNVPPTMPAQNLECVAQWSAITYTVAYNGNGSTSGSTTSSQHTYDATNDLATNGFTKTGYAFTGWNTLADGTGTPYASGALAVGNLSATQSATVTLYAQWTINTYYVIFNANTGSGTMSNLGITYNTSANLTANTFTNTGYTFNGWNTAADGSGTAYADAASYGPIGAANVTLYAQWELDQIDIALVPADNSTTVIDDTNNFIYGLEQGMSQADFEALFVAVLGDGRLEITPYNEFGLFGTGTKVELIDNNTEAVLETYYIVIFGDVDGDGYITYSDGDVLYNVDNLDVEWDLEFEPCFFVAGDIDGDGYITYSDGDYAYNIDNLDVSMDQVTGQWYE